MCTLRPFKSRPVLATTALLMAGLCGPAVTLAPTDVVAQNPAKELNIYSHRQPFLIKPFIDAYTKKTGTKIDIVFASKGLPQRLQAEGARSPADIVLTVDIARLSEYVERDLLLPAESRVLKADIPAHLRDPQNKWFAFSKRARIILASKQAADANQI